MYFFVRQFPARSNPRKHLGTGLASISANMMFKQWSHRFLALPAIPVILFSLLYSFASGQQNPSAGTASRSDLSKSSEVYHSDAVIQVHSDLVLIPVTVTDHTGKYVAGLERQHFSLFEDSAQQEIVHFASEDAPVSIGIVFDTSGSMRTKMAKACESANALLNGANQEDEFFLVKFSTEARITVPVTHRVDDIRNQLRTMRTTGTTALLDAVHLAIAEMEHAHNMRKAIVIVSDGEDNSSSSTVGQIKHAVRDHEIVIYALALPSGAGERSECQPGLPCGGALLRDISRQTGGHMFEVSRVDQLPSITTTISSWLRHQYVLGYMPSHSVKNGSYRKVDLKIERPKGYPKMTAVWRHGYYAPKE
jgi:VWFA-related protein